MIPTFRRGIANVVVFVVNAVEMLVVWVMEEINEWSTGDYAFFDGGKEVGVGEGGIMGVVGGDGDFVKSVVVLGG